MRIVHRIHTAATPAEVWELLGDPRRWPEFELRLRQVRGSAGKASAGARLKAMARVAPVGLPVDIVEAVPGQRLVMVIHTMPGLRERVAVDITPNVRRGSDVRVTVTLEGPLARVATVPLWFTSGVTTRVLATRTDRIARAARRGRQGAA